MDNNIKLIRDGKVAVLYSPGFGAGWYSWNQGVPELLFDKEIVEAVLAEDRELAERITKEKYPEVYTGGVDDLVVEWVPIGSEFEVEEYDGNETLHILGTRNYLVA